MKVNNYTNWNRQVWEGTLAAEPEENLAKKPKIIYQFVTESAARFYYNSLTPERAFLALTLGGGGFEWLWVFLKYWNTPSRPKPCRLFPNLIQNVCWQEEYSGKAHFYNITRCPKRKGHVQSNSRFTMSTSFTIIFYILTSGNRFQAHWDKMTFC